MARPAGRPRPETALPGFSHIGRYWDPTRDRIAAKILPGEFYVTPHEEIIVTVLGSCVSACIRDEKRGLGGMNHFMLPAGREGASVEDGASARYGNYAMECLLNEFIKRGCKRSALEIKIFGGGNVIAGMTNIGSQNISFVRHFLQDENLPWVAEDLGGPFPRKVYFDPKSGRVRLAKLKVLRNDTIREREQNYMSELAQRPVHGEVDLF